MTDIEQRIKDLWEDYKRKDKEIEELRADRDKWYQAYRGTVVNTSMVSPSSSKRSPKLGDTVIVTHVPGVEYVGWVTMIRERGRYRLRCRLLLCFRRLFRLVGIG